MERSNSFERNVLLYLIRIYSQERIQKSLLEYLSRYSTVTERLLEYSFYLLPYWKVRKKLSELFDVILLHLTDIFSVEKGAWVVSFGVSSKSNSRKVHEEQDEIENIF